ncbi:hypothetical protein [Adhaeribacter rhizoryzae]|uniref:Uncharacterized protein n=1 Tax=Adhaeribacter rhizoryzae TaxID=2607907 RepID=A0A5M6DQ06_9BACT|nr:hypothetical protein [Adhaeribacter rhizoryzae]KAA5549554.1 hypothetical protein F0145_02930 [Adhaeribacter rhizoryzae]
MSEIKFETLIKKALEQENPNLFDKPEAIIYKEFELAEARQRAHRGQTQPGDNLHYKFEKVRLGVAIALMQVFSDMADDNESKKVLDILKRAAKGNSIAQIDAIITKEAKAFDNLYQDLFINDDGEMLLDLFQRTLHAESKAEMDSIIHESLKFLEIIKE